MWKAESRARSKRCASLAFCPKPSYISAEGSRAYRAYERAGARAKARSIIQPIRLPNFNRAIFCIVMRMINCAKRSSGTNSKRNQIDSATYRPALERRSLWLERARASSRRRGGRRSCTTDSCIIMQRGYAAVFLVLVGGFHFFPSPSLSLSLCFFFFFFFSFARAYKAR